MRVISGFVWLMLVSSATAEPFWAQYDASSGLYPEQCGWGRLAMGGGAQRSLDGGVLTLDGLASIRIVDDYGIAHPIDLGPGESFVMQWRLRVDEVHGFADPAVCAWSEGLGAVNLSYSDSSIYSLYERVWIAEFEPYVFHDYALVSNDLLNYTLSIDGAVAYAGAMVPPSHGAGVSWGDTVEGAASRSVWDYVAFGVVPEPSVALLLAFACLPATLLRARRTRRNTDDILRTVEACAIAQGSMRFCAKTTISVDW
jgi:hypothetical protein